MTMGLFADPEGQIHQSVLIAFGEIATLAAGVLGIDAIYTNKLQKIVSELKSGEKKEDEQPNGEKWWSVEFSNCWRFSKVYLRAMEVAQ